MRFASVNLTKGRIEDLSYFVVARWERYDKQITEMGKKHAPLDKDYMENILSGEMVSVRFPWIQEGLTSKQLNKIWKATESLLYYMRINKILDKYEDAE